MSLLVGLPTTWPGFCDVGTLDSCDEALKCVSCMYYAYHTLRFSSSMFVREIHDHIHYSNPMGSNTITSNTFSVASDDACRCFIGAFRASALLAELAVQPVSFPLNVSLSEADPADLSCLRINERIPTMDSSSGCASAYRRESEA